MRKEKQCSYGTTCSKKDHPFKCAMNHDGLGDIIKLGTILSEDVLCPHERPGFKRCYNGHCTKIHLEGRVEFIEKKKKAYYENKSHDEDNTSASVDKDGFTLVLSKEKVQAIQATMRDLDYQSSNNSSDNEDNTSVSLLVINGIEHECSPETAQAIKETIDEFGHLALDSYEEEWVEVANESSAKKQAKLAKAAHAAQLAKAVQLAQAAEAVQLAQAAEATQPIQATEDTQAIQPMIEA